MLNNDDTTGYAGSYSGLSVGEVASRQQAGLVNRADSDASRSLADILRGNILTPFNALITALAVVVLVVNRNPINSLFFIAMLLNAVVGIIQELKAKAVLDKLVIVTKPRVKVVRDGQIEELDAGEIVQGDLITVERGDQVVVDGEVIQSDGLEVDESLLTGEADSIAKPVGSQVLSGSLVVAGDGLMRATKVGRDSYAAKLSKEAKQFHRASSELVEATNRIMKWIAWLMLLVVPILIIGQLRIGQGNWSEVVVHTVAAIVGMIPEGLVLLTSMAFLLAVVRLARQQVLVQQLPAVETLARVDTLLLDKTGTITDGNMAVVEMIELTKRKLRLRQLVASLARSGESPTGDAVATYLTNESALDVAQHITFNSQRKWSAVKLASGESYAMGAPEIVLAGDSELCQKAAKRADDLARQGFRVVAIVALSRLPTGDKLGEVKPLGLISLAEGIRPDAASTLSYFKKQGVEIKIISGDSAQTVATIARRVGLSPRSYDARDLPDYDESATKFLETVRKHNIFGRVQPQQKRQIVAALQQAGKVVAMTGDGVNDALALKKADLGIAMNSGSPATRAVAEVVLMDNKFSHLPSVLAEGRRVVANIERASGLFIIKNVYSTVLALAVTALGLTYPFLPAQMTVISTLSIGVPAFFLALAPNNQLYRPGFLCRVLSFAIPTGAITALAMLGSYSQLSRAGVSTIVAGTSVSMVVMAIGLAVLAWLARPIRGWKIGLIGLCGGAFVLYLLLPRVAQIFSLKLDPTTLLIVLLWAVIAIGLIALAQLLIQRKPRRAGS